VLLFLLLAIHANDNWKINERLFSSHKILHKKAQMAIDIFTVFLRGLAASIGVHHRNTLLFVNNYAVHLQGMSFIWNKMCVLSTELHENDAFHMHWT
jgi:hypothetical protein